MRKEWTEQIADKCSLRYVYPEFLREVEPIGISPEQIRGKVLVIGQAGAFPEKTLIATPESKFETLREGVETVYCCDTYYPSSPEDHLDIPCINTIFYPTIPEPKPNTAYFELSSSNTFLQKVPFDFFDTVLMFRIFDLGIQIEKSGLIKTIAPHLKKGGVFIGSGGFFPLNTPTNFYEPLTLVKLVELNDFGVYPFINNRGVVLQK